jgi:Protein of unknown function (DUF2971)
MKVYKFKGLEKLERDIETFANNQFYAPNFSEFNDLLEANFNERISQITDIISNSFNVNGEEIKRNLRALIDFKKKIGIYSLTKRFCNEQMWAYYASSHKGYCIEYDLNKLVDISQNRDFVKQIEVVYQDKITTLDTLDITFKTLIDKMFGVKKVNYFPEEEIRLLFNSFSLKNHHQSAITAIYFGHQSSNELKESFYEKFTNRDVKFYEINPSLENHNLERKLIKEFNRKLFFDLNKFNYKIISYEDNGHFEVYNIELFGEIKTELLREFSLAFKEKVCFKQSRIYIFNNSNIKGLITKYPLEDGEYIQFAEALIAISDFSCENFLDEFPFKDFKYDELKERNLKSRNNNIKQHSFLRSFFRKKD